MATPVPATLVPRRRPRQARSIVTVDAIFEATIQVLLGVGLQRLTTIRVAERAGVSVGTLYQYYPNKQALLFGLLQRHLGRVGAAVGAAAEAVHHMPVAVMVPAVVAAYVQAKTDKLDEARALYLVANELDTRELVQATEKGGRDALTAMLATATDARFTDVSLVAYMLTAAMVGATRTLLEGGAPKKIQRALRGHLESLCLGYLERQAAARDLSP